jgi:hypothetical protein
MYLDIGCTVLYVYAAASFAFTGFFYFSLLQLEKYRMQRVLAFDANLPV